MKTTVSISNRNPLKLIALRILIVFLSTTLVFSACKQISKKETAKPIARVMEEYLYASDILDIVPEGLSPQDSVTLINKYVNNWVRERLLVKQAEGNLTEESKEQLNIEQKIQDYRNSLITYAYEKELVRQKLDTIVGEEEIQNYYNQNPNNFELKNNIIKVVYIKVNKKAPDLVKLRNWYKSDLEKDREQLESYCHQYAENFYLDDNSWLFFDDLLKEIPIETYNKELFLKNTRFIETQDSLSLYFVNIKGFKIKNSLSPLSFEIENIKKIILNKRKLALINLMKEDVYKTAVAEKKIEVY